MNIKRISIIIIVCILLITLVGCGIKTMDVEQFKNVMESKGFSVRDVSEQFAAIANKTYVASKDGGYQVEFYEFETDENAINSFNDNKRLFESIKQDGDKETAVNEENNYKYILESADRYMVISRVKNTCIYADIDIEYKENINSILQEINY